jgi:FAD/FMN-containing dehydrogenase
MSRSEPLDRMTCEDAFRKLDDFLDRELSADELRRVEEAGREIMKACVRAGGTITGEHGVGLDKSAYLPLIFSDDDMDAMLAVRAAFDPTGLCNPGKVIPAPRGCGEARAVAAPRAHATTQGATDDGGDSHVKASAAQPGPTSRAAGSAARPQHKPPTRSRGVEEIVRLFAASLGDECVELGDGAVSVLPASREVAVEAMLIAAREHVAVLPSGAGLWLGGRRGLAPGRQIVLSTRKLNRIVEHSPADLVVTAEAGVPLSRLNSELSRSGQWLPLDPPDDGRATVGGVLATGVAGALGAAYGPPRAQLLGARAVLADGRTVSVGGRVVKNVAGYDLAKLFAGSYGTLCLLTELTFKLRPLPDRDTTLAVRGDDATKLLAFGRRLIAELLLPAAVELLSPRAAELCGLGDDERYALLVRFTATDAAVAWQCERALSLLSDEKILAPAEVFEDGARLWQSVAALPLRTGGWLRWRASVLPSHLPELLARLPPHTSAWHASVAAGRLRAACEQAADSDVLAASLNELRDVARRGSGSLVIEGADEEAGAMLAAAGFDAWGVEPGAARLMRAVKRALDPSGLLAPGVFALGN